jgi:hypothetical protein
VESADTYTWIENAPDSLFREFPRMKIEAETARQSYVVRIPRYQEFTDVAVQLAKRDVHFVQIAGNEEIMLTVVAPKTWSYDLPAIDSSILFTENFLTQSGLKRVALECPVRSLNSVLNNFARRGIKIEHIYDY